MARMRRGHRLHSIAGLDDLDILTLSNEVGAVFVGLAITEGFRSGTLLVGLALASVGVGVFVAIVSAFENCSGTIIVEGRVDAVFVESAITVGL